MKQNEVHDSKNKKNIQKLNLDELMNQLIVCTTDFRELKTDKSKTDKFEDKTNDDNKNENKFEEKSDSKSDKNNDKSTNEKQNLNSINILKNLKKNDNDKRNNCDYCNSDFHIEDKCKFNVSFFT